ncbi:MAG: hypothetical protein ACYDBV_05125 [Nitrospiria bacterium]
MPKKINFVVKVTDAKLLDIKKALEAKNIKLDSIIEVYKEEIVDPSAITKAPEPAKAAAAVQPVATPKDESKSSSGSSPS